MRFVFYFFWVFAVPFALAIANVWLLTPPPGAVGAGALRVAVADQQIPAAIIFFTIFAMIVWRFRYELPLSAAVGVGGRRDVPASVRARFEDAAALVDEARRILRAHHREVERELTSGERDALAQALAALERTMTGERFDAPDFDAVHARADRLVGEHLARWRKGELREYAESIGIAVAVALMLRAFVVEAFKIPSGSMIPTLMIGDHIFVNKFTYGPLIPWTDKHLFTHLPPARGGRDGLQVPREQGAGLHQAGDRPPRRHARGRQRPAGDQRLAGPALLRRPVPLREQDAGALRRVLRRQVVLHPLRRQHRRADLLRPATTAALQVTSAGAASAASSRAPSTSRRERCG